MFRHLEMSKRIMKRSRQERQNYTDRESRRMTVSNNVSNKNSRSLYDYVFVDKNKNFGVTVLRCLKWWDWLYESERADVCTGQRYMLHRIKVMKIMMSLTLCQFLSVSDWELMSRWALRTEYVIFNETLLYKVSSMDSEYYINDLNLLLH